METQYFEKEARSGNPLVKILTVVAIIFLLILTVYLVFAIPNLSKETSYISGGSQNNDLINVSGVGIVSAVPNVASVLVTTITEGDTISSTLSSNKEKTNSVIDFIKKSGVSEEDINIVDYNIYPKYEWQIKGVSTTTYPLGKRVIVGYKAVESIEVIMKDNEQIGKILQGSIDSGASQISDLKFLINDEDLLKSQARSLAIKNAEEKAKEIALSLGLELGSPKNFSEEYKISEPTNDNLIIGSGESATINVENNKVEVIVNISYEVK